jgi:hypothetical protein
MAISAATLAGRHPGTTHIAAYFASQHLPPHLQRVARECEDLAEWMIDELADGPELTAGLRKLLEAKDCFVRAGLDIAPEVVSST